MAINENVVVIKMPDRNGKPGPTWKINRRDETRVRQLVDAGGVVMSGGYEQKDSHSDQAIEETNALVDAIPGLTPNAANALIAAGLDSVEKLGETRNADLAAIDGVGAKSIAAIREVVPQLGDGPVEDEDE